MLRRVICTIDLMVQAVRSSETSNSIYQHSQRNIPDDSNLHIRRRKKAKISPSLGLILRTYGAYESIGLDMAFSFAHTTAQRILDFLRTQCHVIYYSDTVSVDLKLHLLFSVKHSAVFIIPNSGIMFRSYRP
jgi:hypothetical protein